jgi:hypothetical protein
MIIIRPDQMQAFGEGPEQVFVENLCQFARTELTAWVESLDDKELLWRVRSAIARARSHGFTWQSSIAGFVALSLRFAPNFDAYPPARAILDALDTEREGRVERLMTELDGEHWEAVMDRYDPDAWFDFAPVPPAPLAAAK